MSETKGPQAEVGVSIMVHPERGYMVMIEFAGEDEQIAVLMNVSDAGELSRRIGFGVAEIEKLKNRMN